MKKYVEKNRNLREPLRIVSEDKFLKNICLWCDISLLNMSQNKFCSKPCAHEYRLRSHSRPHFYTLPFKSLGSIDFSISF